MRKDDIMEIDHSQSNPIRLSYKGDHVFDFQAFCFIFGGSSHKLAGTVVVTPGTPSSTPTGHVESASLDGSPLAVPHARQREEYSRDFGALAPDIHVARCIVEDLVAHVRGG